MSKQKYPQSTSTATSTSKSRSTLKVREHYSHAKADRSKDKRQDEAEARQFKYDSLSLQDKLKSCDPKGSKKQRAKLEFLITKNQPKKEQVPIGQKPIKKITDKSKYKITKESHELHL
jgi:hypothetical protein